MDTDERRFLNDSICVYRCPSVVSFLLKFNLSNYLDLIKISQDFCRAKILLESFNLILQTEVLELFNF